LLRTERTLQHTAVVDDEPALAQLAQQTLQALGYQAHAFTDPVAALAAVRTAQLPFDAVVTDEVMPALTGTQLIEALRRAELAIALRTALR
jgi:CheY-like chemotaxis protein